MCGGMASKGGENEEVAQSRLDGASVDDVCCVSVLWNSSIYMAGSQYSRLDDSRPAPHSPHQLRSVLKRSP